MEIADLITPRSVVAQLRVANKKQALLELAKRAATVTGVHERVIYDVLTERERRRILQVRAPDFNEVFPLFGFVVERLAQRFDCGKHFDDGFGRCHMHRGRERVV